MALRATARLLAAGAFAAHARRTRALRLLLLLLQLHTRARAHTLAPLSLARPLLAGAAGVQRRAASSSSGGAWHKPMVAVEFDGVKQARVEDEM